jgi:tetratricopeptide (TPR) repeat protein
MLGNFFGCGLIMYGDRDRDHELPTFVKTRYFCILGIPLLALGSYRVAQTDNGLLILGREPISTQAVWLNIVVLLAGIVGGSAYGVHSLVTSDWYVAGRQLERAKSLAATGQIAEAADLYEELATGPTTYAPTAAERLAELAAPSEHGRSPADMAAIIRASARVIKAGRWPSKSADLYNNGMTRVNALAASDPRGAVLILEAVSPLAPKGDEPGALARELLERVVASSPDDVDMVSRLAVVYEAANQLERCRKLLEPLREKLGMSEGSRILGQIDARNGKVEPALVLLRAYTRPRLERYQDAEARLVKAIKAAQDRVVERLKSRKADDFDYEAARNAGENQAQAMAIDYLNRHLKDDPEIKRREAAVEAKAGVTQVVLELGVLLLQHAQGLSDPDARKRELAEAESTFLSIKGLAGDNPEYQLSLGQVYYWEAKPREGRAEFDKLLAARSRAPEVLLAIANVLREIGSAAEARELAEEGYQSGTDARVKKGCATLRGLLEHDTDLQIDWLRKGDPEDPFARAILSGGLGRKALGEGDEAAAIGHLKEAVRLYESIPDSPEKLNNLSLQLRILANLSGDQEAYERGAVMIERAVALSPGNSLTLSNAANVRLEAALSDLIGSALDLKLLRQSANLSMLGYLHDDQAGRDALARRLANHPGVVRAMALQEKLRLLAPRSADSYATTLQLLSFTRDTAALRGLKQRVMETDLDLSDDLKLARERESGSQDEKYRVRWTAAIKRAEAKLTEARAHVNEATRALAIGEIVRMSLGGLSIGMKTDTDALVALAEEAYTTAPSSASRSILINALLARADERLSSGYPSDNEIVEKTHRTTDPMIRVAALLSVEHPLTRTAAADPDTVRAADLVRIDVEKEPDTAGLVWWALLRVTHPEIAERVARSYAASETSNLEREIHARLDPYHPSIPLIEFWVHTLAGRKAEAAAALKSYTALGLSLPIEAP